MLACTHKSAQSVSEEWKESSEMFKCLTLLLGQEEFTPLYQLVAQDTTVKGVRWYEEPAYTTKAAQGQTTHKLISATRQMPPHNLHLSIMGNRHTQLVLVRP